MNKDPDPIPQTGDRHHPGDWLIRQGLAIGIAHRQEGCGQRLNRETERRSDGG
jgi:hypothetical protein